MSMGSGTTEEFFSTEMEGLNLRDVRLKKRAMKLFLALQSRLTTCIRRMCLEPKEARQAYDFF